MVGVTETEPCPRCGARIVPIKIGGGVKVCPICRFRWFESGSGGGDEASLHHMIVEEQ